MDEIGGFDFDGFVNKYKWQITLVFLGLILAGLGVLGTNFLTNEEEGIEIISEGSQEAGEIFVDIQGAVGEPGVYELASASRVNDLLIKAGGLSSEADREWAAKNLNLAQKLEDGVKIYVPKEGESEKIAGAKTAGKININTASLNELDTLPGIGQAYAQRIIDNRPYQKVDDLLKVTGIGPKTLEKIKDEISVY